jgi:hypothetical protein
MIQPPDPRQSPGRALAWGDNKTAPRFPLTNHSPGEGGPAADSRDDETWIVAANAELKIRLRSLTLYLQRGGALTDVRLVEGDAGTWTLWVRLKDRPGEYRINQFASHQPKTYKDVALAVETCRRDFHYGGPITLVTDRIAGGPDGQAAKTADRNFQGAGE